MLKRRENLKKAQSKMIRKDHKYWVHNKNILPGKRIFLPVTILEDAGKLVDKARVSLEYEKFKSKITVEKEWLYKAADLEASDIVQIEDMAYLPENNRAEIFRYLCEREEQNKNYFHCGLDLFFINNMNKVIMDFDNKILISHLSNSDKEAMKSEALKWMLDENTLKPSSADPFIFTASVLKNFFFTFEKQLVIMNGEYNSGKGGHLREFIDFILYYNGIQDFDTVAQSTRRRYSRMWH